MMGRLSEYDEEDRRALLGTTPEEEAAANAFWKDANLGARVRELLASEEPPDALLRAVHGRDPEKGGPSRASWAWFREQLLGEQPGIGQILDASRAGIDAGPVGSPEYREAAVSFLMDDSFGDPPSRMVRDQPGTLKTGGATGERLGPLALYDGLGFWTESEDGRAFHHASEEILQQAADAWNRERSLGLVKDSLKRQGEAEEDAYGR